MKKALLLTMICLFSTNFSYAEAPEENTINGKIVYAERIITINLQECRDNLIITKEGNQTASAHFECTVDYPGYKHEYEETLSYSIRTLGHLLMSLINGFTDEVDFSIGSTGYKFFGYPHYTSTERRLTYTKDEAMDLISNYLDTMKKSNGEDKLKDNKYSVVIRYLIPNTK